MNNILPQQRLLLELIIKSGDVTVPKKDNGTMLFRTLNECAQLSWVNILPSDSDHNIATVTSAGRKVV
jgi:hypothetical protein